MNDFIHRKILIREIPLFRKIVIQCILQLRSATVKYRSAVKHPFLFGNVVITNLSRKFEYPVEDPPMNRCQPDKCKSKGFLGKKSADVGRCHIRFID